MICKALRNVPETKYNIIIEDLKLEDDQTKANILTKAFSRYFDANIPIMYWKLEMSKFTGDIALVNIYNELTTDLNKTYKEGKTLCLVGSFGRGKTMTVTNILKKAVQKGYTGLYVTLNDIISAVYSSDAYAARKELLTVNFLVIDEFDSRHMSNTNNSIDFFARTLEDIFRTRSQNGLPLYLCSNSPNPLEAFKGSLKESITSLWNYVEIIPVTGKDFRTEK
jgi:DNA replication protein DnaC